MVEALTATVGDDPDLEDDKADQVLEIYKEPVACTTGVCVVCVSALGCVMPMSRDLRAVFWVGLACHHFLVCCGTLGVWVSPAPTSAQASTWPVGGQRSQRHCCR